MRKVLLLLPFVFALVAASLLPGAGSVRFPGEEQPSVTQQDEQPGNGNRQFTMVYTLIKPTEPGVRGYSGDRQHAEAGEYVSPLRAKVTDQQGNPVVGIPVIFEVVGYPSGGGDYRIDRRMVPTGESGIAETRFRLGSAGGEYQLIARIRSAADDNVQLYTLFAREPDWLLFLFVGLVGGLALFLLGMEVMSRGLLKSAGDKMRSILSSLTNNRFSAMGLGAFVTMVIQSSSATNVMLVSFVNAGLMKFRQTTGIIIGAAVGTTVTAQLIAFRLTDFALLFVAIGFALQNLTGREKISNTGEALMGFGILFFGMHIMSESMSPLRSFDPFIHLLLTLENPVLGILVGALFTAIIQSSSAFVGIMIILGMQGLISLEASIPMLFGSNLGTAVTALIASVKAGHEAKRVAVAVTLFKIFGVMLFVWWIKPFASVIEAISPVATSATDEMAMLAEVIPRQIANAHTVYNVFVALLVIPFTFYLARLVEWLIPGKREEIPEFKINYLDESMLRTPVMAISLAKKETLRMGEVVYEMVSTILPVFIYKNESVLKITGQREQKVNFLRDQINSYLLKISREGVRAERVNESFQILYTVKELELIADVVAGPMHRKADFWLANSYTFSAEGKKELEEYHAKTCRQIKRALEVFRNLDLEKAEEMKRKYKEYRTISFELVKQHYERLQQENPDTLMSSKTHLELMAMLRNINSHATNIARILLQWNEKSDMPGGGEDDASRG